MSMPHRHASGLTNNQRNETQRNVILKAKLIYKEKSQIHVNLIEFLVNQRMFLIVSNLGS